MTEISTIKNRIIRGQKFWKNKCEAKFTRFRNYLEIDHYAGMEITDDQITVAFIHAIIRAKLPSLYYRNPSPVVTPRKKINPAVREITVKNIEKMKAVMEYLPSQIDMERECKKVVLDSRAFGKGVIKIGFEFDMESSVEKKGVVKKAINKVYDFITGKENQPVPEEQIKILVDRFFVKRIAFPNGDFVYDPDSTDGLKGSRWCAEKIVAPLEDIKANKNFKNTNDLKANASVDAELRVEEGKVDSDEERYEYWLYSEKNRFGIVTSCCYVALDGDGKELQSFGNPYNHRDYMYEELDAYVVPDRLFPVGDIQPIETQQNELDDLETIQFRHAKNFIQKYSIKKGKLTSKVEEALTTAESTIVELDESSDLRAIENPSVNQTIPLSTNTVKQDITRISAVSDADNAVQSTGNQTLGELQMVQDGADNRKEDDRKDVVAFMERVFRKLMTVVQQYSTEEMTLLISGDGTKPEDYLDITPEEIAQGEYDVKVDPNSMMYISKGQMRKDAMDLYELFNGDKTIPIEGINEARKWVLEAFDKSDFEKFMTPIPEIPAKVDANGDGLDDATGEPMVDELGNPIDGEPVPMDENGKPIFNHEPVPAPTAAPVAAPVPAR